MADDVDVEAVRKQLADAFRQISSDLDGVNRKARDATASSGGIGKLDAVFSGMAKTLLGTAGVAAGFYQVAKSLESVAAAGVQLQYLARDSGYAVKSVTDMQGAMRMMGASAQEANRTVGNLGDKMQSLAVFKEGSEIWQGMAKFPGAGAAIANTLMGIAKEGMKTGDQMGATAKMLELFNKQSPETKYAWAQVWGESVSHLENMARKLQVVREMAIPQLNTEAQEKYLQYMVGWQLKIEAVWNHVGEHILKRINEISDAQGESALTTKDVIDWSNDQVDKTIADFRRLIQEMREIRDTVNTLAEGKQPFGKDFDWLNKTPAELWREKQLEALGGSGGKRDGGDTSRFRDYPQADDPMGADYSRGSFYSKEYWQRRKRSDSGTSDITDFSGRRRSDDLVEVEKDSSKTLVEIRDTLQRMETGEAGNGSAGSAAGRYGQGATREGGALQSGLGGFRPGGVGTRADRNNNPGNIEYGEFAKKMGATGSDGRFAIFPDRETGFKAAESLLGGKGYAGLNLAQIGSRWAEGDPGWAKRVSKVTGIPLDAVPNDEQRQQIARQGLLAAEGSRYGFNGGGGNNTGGGAIPSAVLEQAKKAALTGGPGAVFDFIRSQGYNVNSAWCGDFAAATVKAAGGTPPKNPQVASNWRNYGQQVETPEPGDIAVRKGVRTGSTGSHVTVVDSVGRNQFYGVGGNQGSPRSRFSTGTYEFFRDNEAARRQVDKAQAPDKWSGGLNAKVEFLNVPNGVKTSADSEGDVFKQLQISRTKQMGVYNQPLGYE
jgi:hypothetical protein